MPDLELGQKLSNFAREYANLAISSLKVSGVVLGAGGNGSSQA
jgi:hypothetical protein